MASRVARALSICGVMLLIACSGAPDVATPAEIPKPEIDCNPQNGPECLAVGMQWESGFGKPPRAAKAARHYKAACDADELLGCYNLAVMLRDGVGVEANVDRAKSMFAETCEKGEQNSCANVAYALSHSATPEPDDLKRAAKLYRVSCDAGVMNACFNLADMNQAGRGVARDMNQANALFRRACYGGQRSGCLRWAWLGAQECTGETNQCAKSAGDEREAAALVASKCSSDGTGHICAALGVHLVAGRLLKRDGKSARAAFERSCTNGESWGCTQLGMLEIEGKWGPRDAANGGARLDRACESGFAPACVYLASGMLAPAVGSDDKAQGLQYLMRSCELNEATGCNTLRLLCQTGEDRACVTADEQ